MSRYEPVRTNGEPVTITVYNKTRGRFRVFLSVLPTKDCPTSFSLLHLKHQVFSPCRWFLYPDLPQLWSTNVFPFVRWPVVLHGFRASASTTPEHSSNSSEKT